VSFYRDDFNQRGLHANARASHIPFEVEGAHVVIVDDVLYTGRTIRAAMNELFDFGRPARIDLAVLTDRGGRELPIAPTFCPHSMSLPTSQMLALGARRRRPAFLPDNGEMSFMTAAGNPQLNRHGELNHLLTIEGLPRDVLIRILDTAAPFSEVAEREVKKIPLLRGKSVFNLFFENSTRTRTTFEIAAKRLSADVINLNINTSSGQQG
jgi:hypothetical protein